MKVLFGSLLAMVAAAPAFAVDRVPIPPRPVPLPELAVGGPAMLAVIGAYVIARMVVRHRAAKAVAS